VGLFAAVANQRVDGVLAKALAPAEEGQFNEKRNPDYCSPEILDQPAGCLDRPSGCQKVVMNEDAVSL